MKNWKSWLFLLLVIVLMLPLAISFAAEANYPTPRKDIDMDGKDVYFYDYWTGVDWTEWANGDLDEYQQATVDYRKWMEDTFNVKLHQIARGDWSTSAEEMTNFVLSKEGTLATFTLEPGQVGNVLSNDLAKEWTIDVKDKEFNQATNELTTKSGKVYGVSKGKADPRQLLYFNKRVLKEAGIDWNEIYDLQQEGKWTWEAFEKVMKKVQRDTDKDGQNDIYGLTGSKDDLLQISVFSNGGSFFEYTDSGNLVPVMNAPATTEGLTWATELWDKYGMSQPEGSNWDWFTEAFMQGNTAFCVFQAYGGFNDNSDLSHMEDEWGCVAFPTPENGKDYVTIATENITYVPAVYTDDVAEEIEYLYDLWTRETPGYENEDTWIGNKYSYTDERAVDETYAMLRESDHQVMNKSNLLGSTNDVLGASLLWSVGGEETIEELIENGMADWQERCKLFNKKSNGKNYGFVQMGGNKYYLQKDGTFAISKTLKISGKEYTFNEKGILTQVDGKDYVPKTSKQVEKILLSATEKTLKVKGTLTLTTTISPDNADNKKLSWSSSDEKVATVSKKGVVKAVGVGKCTITAKAADGSGVRANCIITVKGTEVKSIKLNTTDKTLKKGKTLTLKATTKPADVKVTWSSSNEKVATVSKKGVVKAVGKGTCTITATAGDKTVTCKIRVKK